MASYEGVVVVKSSLGHEEQKQILAKSKDVISKNGGDLNHCDTWGIMGLSNPIKSITDGIFFHYTFNAKGESLKEIERLYRLDSNVIKYIHINLGANVDLKKHVDEYKDRLTRSAQAEEEREQKRREKKSSKYF